jgi:hypothetical protein
LQVNRDEFTAKTHPRARKVHKEEYTMKNSVLSVNSVVKFLICRKISPVITAGIYAERRFAWKIILKLHYRIYSTYPTNLIDLGGEKCYAKDCL